MEQQIGSNLGKEYIKVVYSHPAYLTSMRSCSVAQSCLTLCDPYGLQHVRHNAELDEAQARIKTEEENTSN